MKQKLLSILFVLTCLLGVSFAQNRQVTGKVTSAKDGTPISGVSVSVVGSTTATQTDADGKYTISVPSVGTLSFSYIGYVAQRIALSNQSVLDVQLSNDESALEEVLVTGYGTQLKKEFTGAASSVKGAVLADRPIQSFGQGLTGQASGVNIVQPNGLLNNPPVIRVRGLSSISLSSFPLVVVDGIPISTNDVSVNAATNNPLSDINPADIESIDILKDAASASIYGSRAAAGVLVITTKRGKVGATKVTYDGWVGVTSPVRLQKVLNAQQYMDFKNNAIANALQVNPGFTAAPAGALRPSYDENGDLVDVNWADVIYRDAFSQNHNLTVSGGTEKTRYYFSAGMTDQDGFLAANNFKRRNGRFNIDHNLTDWLKIGANINFTNNINNAPNSGSNVDGAFASSGLGRLALTQAPNVPIYNPATSSGYNVENNAIGRGANAIAMQWSNPQVLIDLDRNTSENNRLFSNFAAEAKLLEGLTFKTSFTWDLRNTQNNRFWNPINGDGQATIADAYNNQTKADNWNWINTLQYQRSFDDHNLNLIVGSDAQKTRITNWGAIRQGLTDPFFDSFQGVYLTNLAGLDNGIDDIAFEAYLASASYNYAGKYFISGNFRRDGNSALSERNRWGNFGGASIGWGIHQEEFFKSSSLARFMSNFMVRASWGRTGNGNLTNYYGAYSLYGSTVYGAAAPSIFYDQAGNPDLKWETNQQTNVGVDLGFFNNRLSVEANWFNKNIDNLILEVPQAPSKGIPENIILTNVGSMYNRGWEFALNATPVSTNNFSWRANLNVSFIKNEVTALIDDNTPILGYTSGLELTSVTMVGYSAANIYGVRTTGVNPENGRRIFIDNQDRQVQYQHLGGANAWTLLDGTPVSASSVTGATRPLGNTMPTYFGGFNNTFTYKNWDLLLNFTFSGGNYIYNGTRAGLYDQRVWNNSVDVLDAWSPENTGSNIPRPIYSDNVSNGSAFLIEEHVEKGDFLRLQTATLGYRLPERLFGRSGISSARFYLQANNLFLLTGYTGVDPEISSNGNSNISSGIERNSIPQGRAFTLGVSVGF
ncbi:SusC/RagA family TonB-linked outer membrane protein [Sphingobacterium deserti]|uniref:TonB-dependent receptor n=1 Tax=Sphingobacterium deserti TaxID=1229276 RepID=A0A0B8T0J6_9SPHI|nr:TonB-dependent receptor [Sphingobacterium deserti]KGE14122.1 TonB-dependent receptor [Sphingobacterium deserti]